MKVDSFFLFALAAALGALCQEVMQWYELRNKLKDEDFKKLFSSLWYWVITFGTIIFSGVGTTFLFYDPNSAAKVPFIIGAAFPLIFKKLRSAWESRDLGGAETDLPNAPSLQEVAKKYYQ
jgi:hypothetical protein